MNVTLQINGDGKQIPMMNYLKGFSILTVALMHLLNMMWALPEKLRILSSIGGTGVHIFFLCSGVGLYLSYLHHKTGFWGFLQKRFGKIYLPYIIIVLISFFLPWMYTGEDRVMALLSHVFLFKMFVPEYIGSFGMHYWFISTIIQMYLLFVPMCMLKEKMKSNKVFLGVFVAISAAWWILCAVLQFTDGRVWNSFCLQYIWEFALGFVIADMLYEGKIRQIPIGILGLGALLGLGLQGAMAFAAEELRIFNDIPALVGYLSLAMLLSMVAPIRWICEKLSTFSYEYYLVHVVVYTTVFHVMYPLDLRSQLVAGVISMCLALVCGYGYHQVIKRISVK